MMNGRTLWFPGGTKKAVTFSYDDGVVFDRRLCEILNAHGMKCTFNINSMRGSFDRHMPIPECIALYQKGGHEVAYHGRDHMFYHTVSTSQVMRDVVEDRVALEALCGDFIIGGAYPYGSYNRDIKEVLRLAGICYSRTVNSTNGFELPTDWLEWNPTCHHANPDLMGLLERFLGGQPWISQLFFLWGHSYEFNDQDNWEIMEKFCARLDGEHVWFATNGEVYEYVNAYRSLRFTADESVVYNPTQIDVWFAEVRDAAPILVRAGKRVCVDTGKEI